MKAKPTKKAGEITLKLDRHDEPLMAASSGPAASPALTIKQILVPVDFSPCARKALAYALPFAKTYGATITLLHVVEPIYLAGEYGVIDAAEIEASLRQGGQTALEKFVAEEIPAGIRAATSLRVGSPAREVVQAAKDLPADLLVISTHGRTGLGHVLLGSVTERVVRAAPCPVLVVREREHEILIS